MTRASHLGCATVVLAGGLVAVAVDPCTGRPCRARLALPA